MAASSAAADQTADLVKNLSLDSQAKSNDAAEVVNNLSSGQHGSISSGEPKNESIPPREQSLTPLLQEMTDPNMYYMPNGYPSTTYYYAGHDGSVNGWDGYYGYGNHDGGEMPTGVYGDMYHNGYGYAPYGMYASPGGHDAQLYGPQQHYQYPTQYYQPPAPTSANYPTNQAPTSQREVSTSAGADQASHSVGTGKATSNGNAKGSSNGRSGSVPPKSTFQNPLTTSYGVYGRDTMPAVAPTPGYQLPRHGYDGLQSQWYDGNLHSTGQHRPATSGSLSSRHGNNPVRNQNQQRSLPHLMGLTAPRPTASPSSLNKVYLNDQMYGRFGNNLRSGWGYGANNYDPRTSGRWSQVSDSKYKPRSRGNGFYSYGNENLDGFSELNKGPRSDRYKNQKEVGSNLSTFVKGQNPSSIAKEDPRVTIPNVDQYNREDFPVEYSDAKFFIIKSYSEDDVHKSIKYSVWASTPNGNKKLDAAYQEAQAKAGGCPIFLLFSVNTSGQFVGIAEMVGPVDFDKTVEYWQQDKWFGCFPVKWHIVKDVPNNILKHITLENNENKPVTNSRDTQEVKLELGLQMLKLFKEHVVRTLILEDFGFYDTREKMMQEKRAKQQQALDGKATDDVVEEKDIFGASGPPTLEKPRVSSVSVLNKEAAQFVPRKPKSLEGNDGSSTVVDDVTKIAEQATEDLTSGSAVSNGC